METQSVFLTEDGRQRAVSQLEFLRTVKRAEVAQYLQDAKESGDVVDNAAYEDARNEQARLENRISEPPRPLQTHTLKESIETLSVELTRFRSTHATRKFNIEHVESYFVYFYILREIGESLLGMDALAEQL